MHRTLQAGMLPVLLMTSVAAHAAPVITEAEFLSVLDETHPAVVEASQAVAMARARVVAAKALENPSLGVSREDLSGPSAVTDWTLSWQLPQLSRRPEIRAQQESVAVAEARRTQNLLSLRLAMRQTYAEWALAVSRRERLAMQAERVEALAARETSRAEHGEASGLEAHRLGLAAAGLRARLALVGAAALKARGKAKSWHPDLSPEAEPRLPELPMAPKMTADHPLLREARSDLGAATLERQAAGRFAASPELTVGWQNEDDSTRSLDGPILGVLWSVPVFRRGQADQALANARIASARARVEGVRREIDAAREAALATYRDLAAAARASANATLGNDRMLSGAEAAFRQGEASLTDLLETLRAAAESEMTVLDLHAAALAAHRELLRLAGPGAANNPSSQPISKEPIP